MDKITLKNLEFYGYHGVLPEEQEKGQRFFIDAEMFLSLEKAGRSDNIEDTADYSAVFEIIRGITENKKFRLIEKLADSISREILSRFEVIEEIIIRVRKPDAPIKGKFDWAEVEIKRLRE